MKVADFSYDLPEERIAQEPVEPREAARLLVHERASSTTTHRRVADLPELLAPGDLLVVNDTRVVPARLLGTRASGGRVELLLLGAAPPAADAAGTAGGNRRRALVRPAKRLRPGERIELEGGALVAIAVERLPDRDGRPGAEWVLEIDDPRAPGRDLDRALEQVGRMPLPPYVRRARADDPRSAADRERYQTVFAREPGAVAAPTAGLHLSTALIERLAGRGIRLASVTLHVGAGTFLPVTAEDVSEHRMHAERYALSAETVRAVESARARGGRIVAVGTTSVRVLESCADEAGRLHAGSGETSIFLTPGHRFRCVDALLTNFHLPRSTLLMLVAAFVGRERVLALYREAIERGYRFYSYGDAMLCS